MYRSFRAAFFLAASCAALVATCPPSAIAASTIPPTATCIDGRFFDGLDSTGEANYCAAALDHFGYKAAIDRDTAAQAPLKSLDTDSVFFQAGHSIVVGGGNIATAISTLMPATGTDGTFQGLEGDPSAAPTEEGPSTVCGDGTSCRQVEVVTFPYETEMAKFNLALFESCSSAYNGVQGYTSLATIAYNQNVGTAIGFSGQVFFTSATGTNVAGDAFARRFWADAEKNESYAASAVDAANAAGGSKYGYSTYVVLHHAGAPASLSPAQYYIP